MGAAVGRKLGPDGCPDGHLDVFSARQLARLSLESAVGDAKLARTCKDGILDSARGCDADWTVACEQSDVQRPCLERRITDQNGCTVGASTAGRTSVACHDHTCEGIYRFDGQEAEHVECRVPDIFVHLNIGAFISAAQDIPNRGIRGRDPITVCTGIWGGR
jgi:hypothetical protein